MHSLFFFGAFVFIRDLHSEMLASMIVYFVLCTVHRVHLHCATALWLVYYAQRDNEGTTKGQQGEGWVMWGVWCGVLSLGCGGL